MLCGRVGFGSVGQRKRPTLIALAKLYHIFAWMVTDHFGWPETYHRSAHAEFELHYLIPVLSNTEYTQVVHPSQVAPLS